MNNVVSNPCAEYMQLLTNKTSSHRAQLVTTGPSVQFEKDRPARRRHHPFPRNKRCTCKCFSRDSTTKNSTRTPDVSPKKRQHLMLQQHTLFTEECGLARFICPRALLRARLMSICCLRSGCMTRGSVPQVLRMKHCHVRFSNKREVLKCFQRRKDGQYD